MVKVLILVEGQTEETFVRRLLVPHLAPREVLPVPVVLKTRRNPGGADYRGGHVSYHRIKREVTQLLRDSSAVAVTTMLDLYGLPHDFPRADVIGDATISRAVRLEAAFASEIGERRFRPYLQLYEFEALLFADVAATHEVLMGEPEQLALLEGIRRRYASPEEIDDHPKTAPSRRLKGVFPGYQKVLHGPRITARIGLPQLCRACPHFGEWVAWLEGLMSDQ